jgi:anti-anti-sigma factor
MTERHATSAILTLDCELDPPLLILRPIGELDFSNTDVLSAATIAGAADGVTRIVIDLADLTFCDLTGLVTLRTLRAYHEVRGRHVVVVNPRPILQRVCTILGDSTLAPSPVGCRLGSGVPGDPMPEALLRGRSENPNDDPDQMEVRAPGT